MTRTLIVLVLLVVLLLVLVWTMQRRLIYFPTGGPAGAPPESAGRIDAVTITTDDAVVLGAWFLPAAGAARATVLVCNGNAGNRSHRLPFAIALRRLGADVLLFDYRGYGGNPGSPSEAGLATDARAARAYLAGRPGVDQARLIYFGESLGAAVAAGLAETHPPAALILRSPFASLAAIRPVSLSPPARSMAAPRPLRRRVVGGACSRADVRDRRDERRRRAGGPEPPGLRRGGGAEGTRPGAGC